MELRFADPAGRADLGDRLAAAHRIAALGENLVTMRIGADPTAWMLYQHEVAVAAQFVAGIGDNTALDRGDRGATRRRDVDPVIVADGRRRAVAGKDLALYRPREMPAARQRRRRDSGSIGRRLGARVDRGA